MLAWLFKSAGLVSEGLVIAVVSWLGNLRM